MGEAKRRKQLDPNYGTAKPRIKLGKFMPSSEVSAFEPEKAQIKDYGTVCPFIVVCPNGDEIKGLAYPGLAASGKVVVGMVGLADPHLKPSVRDAQVKVYKECETALRSLVAHEFLFFSLTGEQRMAQATVLLPRSGETGMSA